MEVAGVPLNVDGSEEPESSWQRVQQALLSSVRKGGRSDHLDCLFRSLSIFAWFMFVSEYALALVLYAIVYCYGLQRTAQAVVALFLACSTPGQLRMARAFPTRYDWNANLKKILCVPMAWSGTKRWLYDLVARSVNTVHILSSAVAAAGAYSTWPSHQATFEQRWKEATLEGIGEKIGELGLPTLLTIMIGVNFICHLLLMVTAQPAMEETNPKLEGANLLFLEKVTRSETEKTILPERFIMLPYTKLPMLWAKVSLLAISFDTISRTEYASLALAIGSGWYAVLQVMYPAFTGSFKLREIKRHNIIPDHVGKCAGKCLNVFGVYFAFALSLILIAVIASHNIGIVTCKSHDFSVVSMSCT